MSYCDSGSWAVVSLECEFMVQHKKINFNKIEIYLKNSLDERQWQNYWNATIGHAKQIKAIDATLAAFHMS